MSDEKDRTTYADKLTLDEISENDLEMTKDAIKNANKYHFGHDMQRAAIFIRECLALTLKRLGVKVPVAPPPNLIGSQEGRARHVANLDKALHKNQIRIEHRNQYVGRMIWRCGIYVYQRDELVCFISDVLTERRQQFAPGIKELMKIGDETFDLLVITNARMDETQRIYDMGAKTHKTDAGLIVPKAVGGVQ